MRLPTFLQTISYPELGYLCDSIKRKINYVYINEKRTTDVVLSSDPFGARTQDPNIKSVVLYQLS